MCAAAPQFYKPSRQQEAGEVHRQVTFGLFSLFQLDAQTPLQLDCVAASESLSGALGRD